VGTVGMAISRQVRITRSAISPRFATRTLVTLANRHQHFVGGDDRSLFGEDLPNRPADRRHDVVLHLHRLQHHDHVAQPDAVPGFDLDLDHHALHWRLDGPVATGALRRCWARRGRHRRGGGHGAVAEDANPIRFAIDLDRELAGRRLGGGGRSGGNGDRLWGGLRRERRGRRRRGGGLRRAGRGGGGGWGASAGTGVWVGTGHAP